MTKEYRSKLINDEELAKRFNSEALMAARNLRNKYYSLFEYMTEDDIVMECWDKIMRQDIDFDPTRNCKFESFVKMMVNNRCIDMCRKIKKYEGTLSLDSKYSSDNGDVSTLADYLPDEKSSGELRGVELNSVIESLCYDIPSMKIGEIISLLSQGYNSREVCEQLNIKGNDVRAIRKDMKGMVMRRYTGSSETLADVLYGNEEILVARKDELTLTLSYIKDSKGIKLSDVVNKVIDGYTYDGIGKSFGVSGSYIKSFLDRCSTIIV